MPPSLSEGRHHSDGGDDGENGDGGDKTKHETCHREEIHETHETREAAHHRVLEGQRLRQKTQVSATAPKRIEYSS